MEKIIYKDYKTSQILDESSLTGLNDYHKCIYEDEVLKKMEHYVSGNLSGISLYLLPSDAPEMLLIKYMHIKNIKLYYNQIKSGDYDYYEIDSYNYLKLQYSKAEVKHNDRLISEYWIYPDEDYGTNAKYYPLPETTDVKADSHMRILYYNSGEFKKATIPGEKEINSLESFLSLDYLKKKYGLKDKKFYASLLPLIPDREDIDLPTREVKYSGTSRTYTLLEALHSDFFIKEVYEDGNIIFSDYYRDRQLQARSIYCYDSNKRDEALYPGASNKLYYNRREENNYIVWNADSYLSNGKLFCKMRLVKQVNGEEVAEQIFDADTGNVISTEKYTTGNYKENKGFEAFIFDADGKITEIYCDNESIYETKDLASVLNDSFFDTEFGKYFLSPEPLIPELPGKNFIKNATIYKTRYGVEIDQAEAIKLKEYRIENYKNGFLYKVIIHSFGMIRYENYDDTDTIINNMIYFHLYFYNLKHVNGYRIYMARMKDYYSDTDFHGTLVQDIFGREISRIIYGLGKIQFGRKITYGSYMPVSKVSKFDNEYQLLYDDDGNIDKYISIGNDFIEEYTPGVFQSKNNYKYYNIAAKYYKTITELVPEETFLPDVHLIEKRHTGYPYTSIHERKVFGYYNNKGKLKHIRDKEFGNKYFLSKGENLEKVIKSLKTKMYLHYYFDIMELNGYIFCRYVNYKGLVMQMKISKDTFVPEVRINQQDYSVQATLSNINDNRYWYQIKKIDNSKHYGHFHAVELVRELLLAVD